MKYFGTGLICISLLAMGGCAQLPKGKSVNYNDLPGSGDSMAKGPGIIDGGHYDPESNSYLLYSDNPNKNALVNKSGSQHVAADNERDAEQTDVSAERGAPPAKGTTPVPATSSAQQQSDYRQFQQFRQFKKFEESPANSSERQRFEEWQQWQQYKRWKRQQGQSG